MELRVRKVLGQCSHAYAPFTRVNPPMVILGAFVRERATADIAGVLLQPFVNVPHVPSQILLDSIRLPAYVALARPLVGMNANVTQKAALREYDFLTSDALVGDPSVDRLLRFIQQFQLVGILDPVHVRVPAYVLLQFGLFRETSAAQLQVKDSSVSLLGSFLGMQDFFPYIVPGNGNHISHGFFRLLDVQIVNGHVLFEVPVSAVIHQLTILTIMHASLVLGVHVIYEILHADENDIALSALDVLCLLIVCTIIFGRDVRATPSGSVFHLQNKQTSDIMPSNA